MIVSVLVVAKWLNLKELVVKLLTSVPAGVKLKNKTNEILSI